jgi:hypothetical protein
MMPSGQVLVPVRPEALAGLATFFRTGLGCPVVQLGDAWARVETGGTPIALQAVDRWVARP